MMAAGMQGEQRKQTLKDKITVGEEEWNNTEPLGRKGEGGRSGRRAVKGDNRAHTLQGKRGRRVW